MESYQYVQLLLNAFELSAAVTGFAVWNKLQPGYWKVFPCLLAVIFITEMVAKVLYFEGSHKLWIQPLYTYFSIPVMITGFLWLMGKSGDATWCRSLSYTLIALFLLVLLIEELFLKDDFRMFGSLSYQAGCVCLLVMVFLIFFRLLKGSGILFFKQDLFFWMALGIAAYMIITMPFMAFRNSLFLYHKALALKLWYGTIVLNCFMYSCFIAGFLLFRPERSLGKSVNTTL